VTENTTPEQPIAKNAAPEHRTTERAVTEGVDGAAPPAAERQHRPGPVADETARGPATTVSRLVRDWLPTLGQMRRAVQLHMTPAAEAFAAAPTEPRQPSLFDAAAQAELSTADEAAAARTMTPLPAEIAPAANVSALSMRQGMGLVVVTALLAGLLPFIWNWITAVRLETSVPLLDLARFAARPPDLNIAAGTLFAVLDDMAQTIVGLGPRGPVWLAAGLTALGEWINWPLRWLSLWMVYGLGVLVTCLLLGATTTLQRFYALTSYAAIPLLLTGLAPIPCIGVLAALVGSVWAVVMYGTAVRAVTGLDWLRVVLSLLAPLALAALLGFLSLLALAAVWWQWIV